MGWKKKFARAGRPYGNPSKQDSVKPEPAGNGKIRMRSPSSNVTNKTVFQTSKTNKQGLRYPELSTPFVFLIILLETKSYKVL